jgi:uncharacterized protein YjgD (DUF1641 family)
MFWRFGFHACSAIDTLLDKPDVTLEEILGEDDLLQECKAHNTKLIEYLRDPKILAKLLNYIIADEQVDDKAKFKYNPSFIYSFLIRVDIRMYLVKSFLAKFGRYVKLLYKVVNFYPSFGRFWIDLLH